MAGIILNGSVIKGLILNGSPVTAMLNGVKVFPTGEPAPTKEMLFNDTNTYSNNATITLPEMRSNQRPYIAFRFYGRPGALGDIQFFYDNDGVNTKYMGVRGHPYISYAGIVGINVNWKITSCTPITTMTQGTVDGTNYYQTSLWPKSTNKWIKYVFDRAQGVGYVYVESTLVCSITVSEDAAKIDKIIISDDQGSGRDSIGNISVAGFDDLDEAKNYSGPF